jgi:Uma2 family endonuclease
MTVVATSTFSGRPFTVDDLASMPDDGRRYELQPDVLVARSADLTEKNLPVAPLLGVELLSPSTALYDLNLKKAAYARMGVAPTGWWTRRSWC